MTVAELLTFLMHCDQSKEVLLIAEGWQNARTVEKDDNGDVTISSER